ncbi:MAG: YdiU family protein, partial [Cyclobacteriaceae bacterium]
ILAGNDIVEGSQPLAQAYAGHQFGNFTMLGDGRAVLLGEHLVSGQRFDIQLKGSGRTPFSRGGDGRATYYSMLREYLISEAMFQLNIPTTESLAVVKTGLPVYRETIREGAVLTRVAKSHIRVGTFEYARFFGEGNDLEVFTDYVIKRHFPEIGQAENKALALIEKVMDLQVSLVVNWMRVGFIHGVMNTDNMSIPGETIDYGPCAFMNAYHPETVFSSIDTKGRYAYNNQPRIAHWNLSILANALLPLIDENQEKAIGKATAIIDKFPSKFSKASLMMMRDKLGIIHHDEADQSLISDLLTILAIHRVDYTNFFTELRRNTISNEALLTDTNYKEWHDQWQTAHQRAGDSEVGLALMSANNPVVIPRNHLVEEVLREAESGDITGFNNFLKILSSPYDDKQTLQTVPAGYDKAYQTFCGT